MARRGRPPKPAAVHAANGDPSRVKGHLRDEPKGSGKAPKAPKGLGPIAKAMWRSALKELQIMGIVEATDLGVLASYCEAWEVMQYASDNVRLEGIVIREPILNSMGELVGHKVKRNPAQQVQSDAWKKIAELGSLLGFNPIARARMGVARGVKKETGIEEFTKPSERKKKALQGDAGGGTEKPCPPTDSVH